MPARRAGRLRGGDRDDDRERNGLCPPNNLPNTTVDWAQVQVRGTLAAHRFGAEPAVDAALLVFVDAGLPPREGAATVGGGFLDRLRSMSVDGALPRWSTWWGDTMMSTLVPDDARRAVVEAEMPEVPLAFYEAAVDLPGRWEAGRGAYVLLSEAYREHAVRARSLGWPLVERLGGHLDIVNDPDEIARAVIGLTA